jgi:hypothetical protein
MRNNSLVEIHDHPAFPPFLRDLFTDALQSLWSFSNSYGPIVPRLRSILDHVGSQEVLDLCSGAGGPLITLAPRLPSAANPTIHICLTDKYPNHQAFRRASLNSTFSYESRSVDAANVPADLPGVRTIFSSFHHFGPHDARNILSDAFHQHRGIAIFEVANPAFKTMLITCSIPFLAMFLSLRARPFRWSRLFFTYIIPIIPFALWFDGLISCLRAYSQQELHTLVEGLSTPTYQWDIGEERSGLLPITYLIGHPISPTQTRSAA